MLKIKTPIPIRNQVLSQLRNSILTSKIAPGERLYEERLAAGIGSSRTPIREALHVLEREGLIESIPRVGYVVKALNRDEFDEIVEIRKAIECLAAIWASDQLNGPCLKDLKDNIKASKALIRQKNVKRFVELDARFHELIARASGRKRIYEMSQTLRSHMLFYRVSSIYEVGGTERAVAGHERILEAIQSRDEERIRQAITSHLNQVKKDVLTYSFEKSGLGHPRTGA
jgi:GntR family transcriptional regulator, rspAB operon transcriptional repressor